MYGGGGATLSAQNASDLSQADNFGGESVAPTSLTLNQLNDFTLEVSGTAGVEISIGGGLIKYTPTATGTVRFAMQNQVCFVFEGSTSKGTVQINKVAATYPTITDANVATSGAQILQDPSFEDHGSLVGGTNYNFGSAWITSVTVASSGGIRVTDGTTGNVNGTFELLWRGRNSNYFAQKLTDKITPNTLYQIKIYQIAGANSAQQINVGLGSNAPDGNNNTNGLEYGYGSPLMANGNNGLKTFEVATPATVAYPGVAYFTVKNRTDGTGNTDPLSHIDYISLVAASDPVTVTGVTGDVTYLAGTAYAPVRLLSNVTLTYLPDVNTEFNTGYTTQTGNIATSSASLFPVTGWTSNGAANACAGVINYGTSTTFNGGSVPASGYNPSAGGAFFMSVGWGASNVYTTDNITLPAGEYYLEYATNNRNANGVAANKFGFVPTNGTAIYDTKTTFAQSWEKNTLSFTLNEATEGKISIGYTSPRYDQVWSIQF